MVVNGLSDPLMGSVSCSALPGPAWATREELAGVCRRHERGAGDCKGNAGDCKGNAGHCTAGERGSNPSNSVQRLHVPCPSDAIFVRKSAIDRPFINPPRGIVN